MFRSIALAGIAGACLAASLGAAEPTEPTSAKSAVTPAAVVDHVHDFDSFFGNWHSRQRRLKQRLAGSHDWVEFEGTQTVEPILNGHGNMTDNTFASPDGATHGGVTLRAYDPKTQRWSIWWLDANDTTKIDTPVVGAFQNGVGEFYSDDTFDGKPIKVRYRWLNITPTSRQWEQAFSPDGGKTWETNWIAYYTKMT